MNILENRYKEMEVLEADINHKFSDKKLMNSAFIHTSYTNEHSSYKGKSNERLEFLGDAVLEIVYSEILYKKFPYKDEGYLTKLRSNMVCEESFANLSDKLSLSKFLLLGKGEEKTGGREKDSIKADLFEAFCGAFYLDAGYDKVYDFIYGLIKNRLDDDENYIKLVNDYKSMLQEHLHKYKNINSTYKLIKEEGPAHNKKFYMEVYQENKKIGAGMGKNKKEAEQMAAKDALGKLGII